MVWNLALSPGFTGVIPIFYFLALYLMATAYALLYRALRGDGMWKRDDRRHVLLRILRASDLLGDPAYPRRGLGHACRGRARAGGAPRCHGGRGRFGGGPRRCGSGDVRRRRGHMNDIVLSVTAGIISGAGAAWMVGRRESKRDRAALEGAARVVAGAAVAGAAAAMASAVVASPPAVAAPAARPPEQRTRRHTRAAQAAPGTSDADDGARHRRRGHVDGARGHPGGGVRARVPGRRGAPEEATGGARCCPRTSRRSARSRRSTARSR